jgi:hypothetical protein
MAFGIGRLKIDAAKKQYSAGYGQKTSVTKALQLEW